MSVISNVFIFVKNLGQFFDKSSTKCFFSILSHSRKYCAWFQWVSLIFYFKHLKLGQLVQHEILDEVKPPISIVFSEANELISSKASSKFTKLSLEQSDKFKIHNRNRHCPKSIVIYAWNYLLNHQLIIKTSSIDESTAIWLVKKYIYL